MSTDQTSCVIMLGPEPTMDQLEGGYKPANPLPTKCPHCTFPDLNAVAQPYLLTKGISSPAETFPAQAGNFLIRERVRKILQLAAPDACAYYPTIDRKSKKPAPWWLAVPCHIREIPNMNADPPYCSKCREPKRGYSYPEGIWTELKEYDSGGVDVFKSLYWFGGNAGTAEDAYEQINRYRKETGDPLLPWSYWDIEPPSHPERWTRTRLDRDLFFSIRMEQLFKRAKVKGQLVRYIKFKDAQPTPADHVWIDEKFRVLAEHGLVDAPKPAGKSSSAAQKWFKQFLRQNAKAGIKRADFAAVEKKHKLTLPQDYKDFIATVGPKSFNNVNATGGFKANVLPPQKLDFKSYRRGKVPYLEGEQAEVDGVMFASTDHGDCFVFDVSAKDSDDPVFWYNHEENTLEPFAPNFAECIKRFALRN